MSMHYPTVWVFGDSITQLNLDPDVGCWGALAANFLVRKCDVMNRGFGGYTSKQVKPMMTDLFTEEDAKRCKLVIFFLGTNDSVLPSIPIAHVPKEEYIANMNWMIDYVHGLGIPFNKILLISPGAFDVDNYVQHGGHTTDRSAEATAEYAVACTENAKARGCLAINLNEEFLKRSDWKDLLVDGIHFKRGGADLLFSLIKPVLQSVADELPQIGEAVEEA